MAKENLTDRRLKALKPAPKDVGRYEIGDAIVPGLLVRVTSAGKKSFVLYTRFGGSKKPTRRLIGEYGAITLEDARRIARDWLDMLGKGVDPKIHIAETKAKEIERQDNTFRSAVEDYLSIVVIGSDPDNPILRQGNEVARCLNLEFVEDRIDPRPGKAKRPGLGDRPISGITKADIMRVIDDAMARGAKTMAHNLLAYVRAFFNWAVDSERYGLEFSPCDRINAKKVIGKKVKRKRVLDEDELAAFWEATAVMGYPYGPAYRLLLITCLRLNEVAEVPETELRLEKRMWSIPALRMKKDNDHHVPLSDLAYDIFKALPEHKDGPFLFTTTKGVKPINGFSKAKVILDREMLTVLKRKAGEAGRDPEQVTLRPFVNHDLRRTARTWLSGLKVPKVVAELIMAHTQKDLDAVYDQWAFIDERKDALQRWANKVRSVVEPPPENVVPIRKRR
ncbi:phage integrase family protein [Neorhizobium sp. R1-B]|uniref:tyrosine-type recombinase/integrase n=1 Tax=Neorhizobium sp. R1-B TaxID=2485162 RepID=UPI001066CAFC|nr:site-specific integrase [Neorhizobium sp. R1-B]TDX88474.1 phage integrase family protein [Neorhizobium sp. R1-B]